MGQALLPPDREELKKESVKTEEETSARAGAGRRAARPALTLCETGGVEGLLPGQEVRNDLFSTW